MIPKKKLTLSIDPALNQRLDFEAARAGKGHDRSSIVDALIIEHVHLPDDWRGFPDMPSATPEQAEDKPSPRQREKTTFYLSAMASRLLGLHSHIVEADRSSIVERLIREHVTPWDLYDPREKFVTSRRNGRQSEAASISPTAALAS